jgi:hypothetical protein
MEQRRLSVTLPFVHFSNWVWTTVITAANISPELLLDLSLKLRPASTTNPVVVWLTTLATILGGKPEKVTMGTWLNC